MNKSDKFQILSTLFVVGGFCARDEFWALFLYGLGLFVAIITLYHENKEGKQ